MRACALEAQLNRMSGTEDGGVDALFTLTRSGSGSYYGCPPAVARRIDLSALGR